MLTWVGDQLGVSRSTAHNWIQRARKGRKSSEEASTRGTTWFYAVDLGRDPITGRRRQVYKRGYASRKAAEAALADAVSEMNRGEFVRPNTATLAEWLTHWLDSQADRVRPATIHSYRKIVNGRIVPGIGHATLSELDAAAIEAWYGRLRRSGGVDARAVEPEDRGVCRGGAPQGAERRRAAASAALQPRHRRPATEARTAEGGRVDGRRGGRVPHRRAR